MPLEFAAVPLPPPLVHEQSAGACGSPRGALGRRSKSARFANPTAVDSDGAPESNTNNSSSGSSGLYQQRRDSAGDRNSAELIKNDVYSTGLCDELLQPEIGLSGSKYNICRRPPTAPAVARRASVDTPPKKLRKDQQPVARLRRDSGLVAEAAAASAEARSTQPAVESELLPLRKVATSTASNTNCLADATAAISPPDGGQAGGSVYDEDDGPASLSEVVRTKLQPHVRPALTQYDTFFDDISGWGEEDSLAVGSGGAAYQYLSLDAPGEGDPHNTSQSPGPDVVQRLKRICIRKRTSRSAKMQGGGKSTALTVEQKKSKRRGRAGYGEDEENAAASADNGEETEEVSADIANVQPDKDEAASITLLPSSMPPRSATLNPSSIPSKARGVKSATLEHVSINAGALMVPRVSDKRRPATGGKPLSVSHRTKTPSVPDLSCASPTAPATDTMAQMRKKLLSSARTNNRNLGGAQNSNDELLRGSALGSAVVTGTKYCSQTLNTSRTDVNSIGTVMSVHDRKPSARHWTSSNSISEPLTLPAPPTPSIPLHQPHHSSALLALESSLTLLPIIATGKQSSRSLISGDASAPSSSSASLPARSGPGLPYASLTPLQTQQQQQPTPPQSRSAISQGQQKADASFCVASSPYSNNDRQLHSMMNPVIRRPVKKLSQNGFQAVAFWDEETPVEACAPPPDLRGSLPVVCDGAIDSVSLPTPLGARSFRDSIFLNRCRGVGT
ncbi:hypothetical protein HDU86_002431 [Geranomyces michiganensis]|nr:hypothetical protein HDU86_002431 [Geranomyces michiganensis]